VGSVVCVKEPDAKVVKLEDSSGHDLDDKKSMTDSFRQFANKVF
jgi:hypothetical protein